MLNRAGVLWQRRTAGQRAPFSKMTTCGLRAAQRLESAMPASLGLADSDDDSLKALNIILEAWEHGADSGIPPEMMAYAALYTALTDLVAAFGEDHVITMVEGLKPRVQSGEFTVYRTTQ
jgi:hypothetical protein